jgi:carbonic anhydrase
MHDLKEHTMMSRRNVLVGAAAAGGAMATGVGAAAAQAPIPARLAPVIDGKTALSPDEALDLLIEGNRNFLNDVPTSAPVGRERRLEIEQGQAPFTAYVTCSDSRVSPEILFGRGLGELFIIRNAGNTVDTVALGSIEYAVAELGVPLIVVMGHESCGAVKAAKAVVEENATFPGSIGRMIEPIIPAVLEARDREGDMLDHAIRNNVSRVVHQLRTTTDPLLLDPQKTGKLKVVGAHYNLGSGAVDFFDR